LALTCNQAQENLHAEATAVYVPAKRAAAAIEEAIEAEVPLIVSVAEFIPLHDMLRVDLILS
jgi:succinyl-CoA synthetase alpha subunit